MRVVRATSIDELVVPLARELANRPPADPLRPVDVAVPGRGMERWLTQRLADELGARDDEAGVCANVRFPFPAAVVRAAVTTVLGDDVGDEDPWTPARLTWPVLEELDDLPDDVVYAPLRSHLAGDGEATSRRRYPLARRIADLMDRYTVHRPGMLRRWSEGDDVDASGDPLPGDLTWQPTLWRSLQARITPPSPDRRVRAALELLADAAPGSTALTDPVTIFGVAGLPPRHLQVLAALTRHVPVTVYAVTPCTRWVPGRPPPEPRHRLLASCGGEAWAAHAELATREVLAPADVDGDEPGDDPGGVTGGNEGGVDGGIEGAVPALRTLQHDIRADRRRRRRDRGVPAPADDDTSIQIHACHGPMRQLEVLREALLSLLEDDPGLEPRDIVVLTPDIATHAPLITAVFSDGDRPGEAAADPDTASGTPALPFRIADRTLREENPVAQVLLATLDLATSRVGATEVIDLLTSEPVRERFGLRPGDLAELPAFVRDTGIRWGIDADHRSDEIGLTDASHTWSAGLDRLALGAAMADNGGRLVGGVVPYDDVEGGGVEAVGRVLTATDTLFACLRSLQAPRHLDAWHTAFHRVVDAVIDPGPDATHPVTYTAELAALRGSLDALDRDSRVVSGEPPDALLTLDEARAALAAELGSRGGHARYGTGAVTFAGLEPLRNVTHRVVCLVGLDDEALPRATHRHGFDLLAAQPRPSDPDPRLEDRQAFLDAVLAAGDHLVITYTGHDPRTNEATQPAAPVNELLDVLHATFPTSTGDDPTDPRERFVTRHPLQPHSQRYFHPADGGSAVPRAFDRRQFAAARATADVPRPPPPFFPPDHPLPAPDDAGAGPEVIELADLIDFLCHPLRHLLHRRIGVVLGRDEPGIEDRDPTELAGLERWRLGDELLGAHLAGDVDTTWREVTLARGTVPVGGPGRLALDEVTDVVDRLTQRLATIPGEHTTLPIDVTVAAAGGDVRLVGTVPVIGAVVPHIGFSAIRARHRIATWTRLLAVTAAVPSPDPHARLLGRDADRADGLRDLTFRPPTSAPGDPDGRDDRDNRHDTPGGGAVRTDGVAPPAPDESQAAASAHLGELIAGYRRGLTEPVPVLPETGFAYARSRARGRGHAAAIAAAASSWEGGFGRVGERDDAYVRQALGGRRELGELAETTTFATDAVALWGPILAAEVKT